MNFPSTSFFEIPIKATMVHPDPSASIPGCVLGGSTQPLLKDAPHSSLWDFALQTQSYTCTVNSPVGKDTRD